MGSLIPETSTHNPLLLLLGEFDLAFVTVYIYPLIILVLGFNMLSAERDTGVLPQMLSQPVRLRSIIFEKF